MLPPLAFTHSYISELRIQDCEFMNIKLQGDRNHLAWCTHAHSAWRPTLTVGQNIADQVGTVGRKMG